MPDTMHSDLKLPWAETLPRQAHDVTITLKSGFTAKKLPKRWDAVASFHVVNLYIERDIIMPVSVTLQLTEMSMNGQ